MQREINSRHGLGSVRWSREPYQRCTLVYQSRCRSWACCPSQFACWLVVRLHAKPLTHKAAATGCLHELALESSSLAAATSAFMSLLEKGFGWCCLVWKAGAASPSELPVPTEKSSPTSLPVGSPVPFPLRSVAASHVSDLKA